MQTEENHTDERATSSSSLVRAHALMTGRVQGVAYRAFTQENARRLKLQGWVRNLPDGRVETEVQGTRAEVDTFLASLHQGPPLARVDHMQLDWVAVLNESEEFRILRS